MNPDIQLMGQKPERVLILMISRCSLFPPGIADNFDGFGGRNSKDLALKYVQAREYAELRPGEGLGHFCVQGFEQCCPRLR